jgi:calpain
VEIKAKHAYDYEHEMAESPNRRGDYDEEMGGGGS